MDDVFFLEVEEVVAAHAAALSQGGGLPGLRDPGLLESAVMRPRSCFGGVVLYPTLATMAAVYLVGLAKNHAFLDANKRTALVACLLFLEMNGYPLRVDSVWVSVVEHVAEGRLAVADIVPRLAALLPHGDVPVEP